jgi:hypothetical protein
MASKKEQLAIEVAKAIGAGKAVAMETVDFNDSNRPKTCLKVDFPILPVNQVAIIEGNAGKPIYQMSKWWARRRSSVFRSMLIATATKATEDKSHAAKLVWNNYYANHQKKGAFKHLKVADIFMGGGTTLVEGSRLGMQILALARPTPPNPSAKITARWSTPARMKSKASATSTPPPTPPKPPTPSPPPTTCPAPPKSSTSTTGTPASPSFPASRCRMPAPTPTSKPPVPRNGYRSTR